MRLAFLLSALLLSTGLALAVTPASSACGGTVDTFCDTGYCSVYAFDGLRPYCIRGDPAYCVVYVDTGRGYNRAPLACVVA